MKINIPDIISFEIVKGFNARMIHTDQATLAFVDIDDDSILPEHAHVHVQVTTVLEGILEMTIGGEKTSLHAGQSVVIPSNVPHSGHSRSVCKVLDVFTPVREDFLAKQAQISK